MTTLNARANQAYREMLTAEDHIDGTPAFDTLPEAFEEGWETGYKARDREIRQAVEIAAVQWEKYGGPAGQQVVEVLRSMFGSDDGLMHTPETAPFPREYVEKKWGPLKPVRTPEEASDEPQ